MGLVVLIPLIMMIRSDFRQREVNMYCLVCFGLWQFCYAYWLFGIHEILKRGIINLGILLFLGLGIVLYLKARRVRWAQVLHNYIGLGDILFFIFLIPVFKELEFPRFLMVSFIFSLIWWGVYSWRTKVLTIPLVSTVCICYVVLVVFRFLFDELKIQLL